MHNEQSRVIVHVPKEWPKALWACSALPVKCVTSECELREMSMGVFCFSHRVCLLQDFINCLEQLSTKTDDTDSSRWVRGCLFFTALKFFSTFLTSFVLYVQRHFSGPVLAGSVPWLSGGLQSNTCEHYSLFLLFPINSLGLVQSESHIRNQAASLKRGLSPSRKQTKPVPLIQTTKCYQAVSWLWTRSR